MKLPHNFNPESLMIKSKNFLVNSKYHKENYRRQDKTIFCKKWRCNLYNQKVKDKKIYFWQEYYPYEMNKFNSVDIDDLEDVKLGEIFLNMKIIFKSFLFLYKSFILFLDFIIWKSSIELLLKVKECKNYFLICSIFTMPAILKFEMILSELLIRNNYSGFILIKSKNKYFEKIISLNKNCSILYFDDFVSKDDLRKSQKKSKLEINKFKAGKKIFNKAILSTALRKLRKGKLNVENKNEEQVLLEVLKEYYLAEIVSAKIINKYSFDLLLINEKGYSPASEIFKRFVKNNINVIQWVSSVNGDGFVFKKYNKNNFKMHPFSLDNQTWNKF